MAGILMLPWGKLQKHRKALKGTAAPFREENQRRSRSIPNEMRPLFVFPNENDSVLKSIIIALLVLRSVHAGRKGDETTIRELENSSPSISDDALWASGVCNSEKLLPPKVHGDSQIFSTKGSLKVSSDTQCSDTPGGGGGLWGDALYREYQSMFTSQKSQIKLI